MKCIHCGTDSKYKERTSGYCPGCRRKFAFEPKNRDRFTDMAFHNAIKAVSADGRLRWGVEHLFYEVNRRILRKRLPAGCIIFGFPFLASFLIGVAVLQHPARWWLAFFALVVLIVLTIGIVQRLRKRVPLDKAAFENLWSRWRDAHGQPAGVIERVEHPPPPKDLEADIGEYSFDRAVICDRARTVDLLVANNFHFENNCAVLSIDGYPKGPFEIVRKMLKRNPKLIVIALHDATPAGCRLAHRLRDPAWFPAGIPIIDVGLRPRHAGPFKGLFLDADGPMVDPIEGVTAAEAQWLTRYKLELAVIRPEQILKRLFAAVNRHSTQDDTGAIGSMGGDTIVQDDRAFAADGGGGGDSGEAGADGFG